MHRPTHLGVIIHFTELETTTVKRPVASLVLAFTGKILAGCKNCLFQGKRALGKITHTHFPASSKILQAAQHA